MRNVTSAIVIALILAALAAGTVSAATPPGTLHLLDLSEGATPAFDAGTGTPRAGDRVFLHDGLFAWKDGKRGARVGHVESTLSFMSAFGARGATVEISGQMFVRGGSLLIDGITHLTEGANRFTLPVVGGTGSYTGARGTLDIRDLGPSGDKAAIDIHLMP